MGSLRTHRTRLLYLKKKKKEGASKRTASGVQMLFVLLFQASLVQKGTAGHHWLFQRFPDVVQVTLHALLVLARRGAAITKAGQW